MTNFSSELTELGRILQLCFQKSVSLKIFLLNFGLGKKMKGIYLSGHIFGVFGNIFVSKSESKFISDICQFCCTTALFEHVKIHQKMRKIATK